jgi:hypothetical protein
MTTSIDLSRLAELRDVTFICGAMISSPCPQWVAVALRTLTPGRGSLQQTTLCVPDMYIEIPELRRAVGGILYRQWTDLDHLLVQL